MYSTLSETYDKTHLEKNMPSITNGDFLEFAMQLALPFRHIFWLFLNCFLSGYLSACVVASAFFRHIIEDVNNDSRRNQKVTFSKHFSIIRIIKSLLDINKNMRSKLKKHMIQDVFVSRKTNWATFGSFTWRTRVSWEEIKVKWWIHWVHWFAIGPVAWSASVDQHPLGWLLWQKIWGFTGFTSSLVKRETPVVPG